MKILTKQEVDKIKRKKEIKRKVKIFNELMGAVFCAFGGFGVFWYYQLMLHNTFLSIFVGILVGILMSKFFSSEE